MCDTTLIGNACGAGSEKANFYTFKRRTIFERSCPRN
jgi:hypothetical protein